MHDKWSMAISLVKFAELFDFTRDDWPPLDPRAELFDAGSGSIRGESPTADLRMDERQAARRLTRDRRALVWSLARFPTRRRHLARSAGTQLITRAVHPPAALSDEGADTEILQKSASLLSDGG